MSFDEPAANATFAADQGYLFELWTDRNRELALHYGAATSVDQAFASRRTVVLDELGRLCLQYESVGVSSHPAEVLSDVTLLLQ